MSRLQIKDQNNMPRVINALQELNRLKIEVGIFGGNNEENHVLMVAGVHEFGTTIRPKKSQYLTIPFPAAGDRSAREIDGLFRPHGTNILAVPKGKKQFEPMFALVKKVEIPERSFLRSTYDENENDIGKNIEKLIPKVISLEMTPETLMNRVGAWIVSRIKRKIIEIKNPSNSSATKENKGSSNPLVDTGRMRRSITWRVVRN